MEQTPLKFGFEFSVFKYSGKALILTLVEDVLSATEDLWVANFILHVNACKYSFGNSHTGEFCKCSE